MEGLELDSETGFPTLVNIIIGLKVRMRPSTRMRLFLLSLPDLII
jgi:hypothetical protein